MTRRDGRSFAFALCCLVCLVGAAGVAGATGPTTESDTPAAPGGVPVLADSHVDTCAATPPADHADPATQGSETVIGWVDGYWYNESLDVTPEGGLDREELDRLTARTAARVEALRCRNFDGLPPLRILSRSEFRTMVEDDAADIYEQEGQRFTNARLAGMLLVGQNQDAVDTIVESQASFPAAFYDPLAEFMGFVTDSPDQFTLSEPILAHELLHALQDDHFDIDRAFEAPTNDALGSSLAVVEGDASLVEEMYRRNCGASPVPGLSGGGERQWTDECLSQTPTQPRPANWGLALDRLAAYNAPLVEQTYEREGWDGVDRLLGSLPDSMVEALDPEKYGTFDPATPTVPDRSGPNWQRVSPPGRDTPPYDVVGQHGLTAMLAAPSFETLRGTNVIDIDEFQLAPGEFDYDIPATDGWRGDSLYAYTNDSGATGMVWALHWTDAANASQFARAYEDLVGFRGGEPTAGNSTFTFPDSEKYDMALSLDQSGDTVQIVTAPTVDALDAVHQGAGTSDGSGTTGDSTDGNSTGSNGTGTGENSTDGSGAGFGVVVAVVAVCGLLVVARRSQ